MDEYARKILLNMPRETVRGKVYDWKPIVDRFSEIDPKDTVTVEVIFQGKRYKGVIPCVGEAVNE